MPTFNSVRTIDVSSADDVGPFRRLQVTTTAGNIAIVDGHGQAATFLANKDVCIDIAGRQVTKVGTTAVGILAFN